MTLTQLKRRALEKLGVIATGEEPNIADANVVGYKYASLLEMLSIEQLVNWTAEDDIPTWAEEPIVAMTAALAMKDFAVPESRQMSLLMEGGLHQTPPSTAERTLRRLTAAAFVYEPAKTEFF